MSICPLQLAKELIQKPSITPADAGCQPLIAQYLSQWGFKVETFIDQKVHNLWARRGDLDPLFVFAGHTDVVPPGPLNKWRFPPFRATEYNGFLYGRGAADMKGGLAAMLAACDNFIQKNPHHLGSIGFLITSDEEGDAQHGTQALTKRLNARKIKPTWCIVGEPSSQKTLGDTVKIGRRGSLHGELSIQGKQGHIAYPQLAENPIHKALVALDDLCKTQWDKGTDKFQPSCLQISNIHAGSGINNLIPDSLDVVFNIRFSPATTENVFKKKIHALLSKHKLNYTINWTLSAKPFLAPEGALLQAALEAIQKSRGLTAQLSTSGGTSDARFIAPLGCELIELGLCNETIHQVDERILCQDIYNLTLLYTQIMQKLLK